MWECERGRYWWRFSQHHLGRWGPERYGGGGAVQRRSLLEGSTPEGCSFFKNSVRNVKVESESEMSVDHLFVYE